MQKKILKNFMLLLLLNFSINSFGAELLVVEKGMSLDLSVSASSRIQSNSSKIIMLQDLGNTLRIVGKDLGKTEIVVSKRRYEVAVLASREYQTFKVLDSTLARLRGLKVTVQENQIRIVGELLRFSDWVALASGVKEIEGKYQFAAVISEDLKEQALRKLGRFISEGKLPVPTITFRPEAKLLVPTADRNLLKAYEELLASYGFKVEENSKGISLEPLIEVRVLVAEIKKKFFYRLGIKWPASYSADVLKSENQVKDLLNLNALEENGLGKILASPILQCRSGKEAAFLAGGEFPIKIANFKTNDVIWKKYGVMLNFKPIADFSGRMSIAIETEISSIDSSQAIDGVPGIHTNRIKSHFDLPHSQTIALSGLIKNDFGQSKEGLPLLTRIPVLGALFSSQDYREEKTELIVFVTPTVKIL